MRRQGAHLWADRFEEDIADLFKLRDQVVARLANSLGYELVRAEARKEAARAKKLVSIDLTGIPLARPCCGGRPPQRSSNDAARAVFRGGAPDRP